MNVLLSTYVALFAFAEEMGGNRRKRRAIECAGRQEKSQQIPSHVVHVDRHCMDYFTKESLPRHVVYLDRGRNSSLVVCWARRPARCSVAGSILLWGGFFRQRGFSPWSYHGF